MRVSHSLCLCCLYVVSNFPLSSQDVLRDLVMIALKGWGCEESGCCALAKDTFIERFDYSNIFRQTSMTGMGKQYLPFWTSAILR